MPPSHISAILASRLTEPVNATATYHHAGLGQIEGDVTVTASSTTSTISGVINPSSSQFIGGGGASTAGRGVAIGVSCSIVAIFLVVMVIGLSIHMDAGKGRYNLNARKNKNHGADTIQLRRPRNCHTTQPPLDATQRQDSTDAIIPGGLPRAHPVNYSPRQGSWKSTLDDKLSRAIETARNWRA